MAQRYQKEIEEILDQVNAKVPARKVADGGKALRKRQEPPRRTRFPLGISPVRLLIAGSLLLLVALVLRGSVPGVAGPLTWIGVGLFIATYVLFFLRPARPTELRWRGRKIEDDRFPAQGNPLARFWHWVNRG